MIFSYRKLFQARHEFFPVRRREGWGGGGEGLFSCVTHSKTTTRRTKREKKKERYEDEAGRGTRENGNAQAATSLSRRRRYRKRGIEKATEGVVVQAGLKTLMRQPRQVSSKHSRRDVRPGNAVPSKLPDYKRLSRAPRRKW